MLSWPTGGGHGRSLITLISTAFVFPPTPTASEEMRGGGGKRKVSGEKEMVGSTGQNKKTEEKE